MRELSVVLVVIVLLPYSMCQHEKEERNHSWEISFEGLQREDSVRYFTNTEDFVEYSLGNIFRETDFDSLTLVYGNQTTNDNPSGCQLNDNTMKCKKVDIFEVAKIIPTTVTHLDIHNSPVQILRVPIFANLTDLSALELTNNSIQYVTSKLFQGLEQLSMLNLSTNHIRALLKQSFSGCPNLRTIDLSRNRIISLRYIPAAFAPLKYLSTLILSDNNITKITRDNLIPMKDSPLEHLNLNLCALNHVDLGSLGHLKNLKRLSLAGSPINETRLFNLTNSLPSIHRLDLRLLLQINGFPQFALSALENTSLNFLDMTGNRLHFLPNNSFGFMPNLTHLNLVNCELVGIEVGAFENVNSLEFLDLSLNYLKSIPSGISTLSNLQILLMSKQKPDVTSYEPFKVPDYSLSKLTSLKALVLSGNKMHYISRFTFHNLVSLKVLLMSGCDATTVSDNSFSTLTSLELLDLSYNALLFLGNNTFNNLRNLRILSLRKNGVFIGSRMYPFAKTPSLEKILLSDNKMKILKAGIFSNLSNLKEIDLRNCEVVSWSSSIFQDSAKPEKLILSNNHIEHVTLAMLDDFDGIKNLDLGHNPFDCHHCGMKEFQSWLMDKENETSSDHINYVCSSPVDMNGKSLFSVKMHYEHCLPENIIDAISLGIVTAAVIIFVLVCAVVIIRFRWYFRYWCFHLHSSLRRMSASSGVDNYQYDAFVSYNSVDVGWVAQSLIPNLENSHSSIRLCIHDRDFEIGRLITENILDSIDKSRQVILVLTEAFVKSQWCMYELHVAQHQLFQNARDTLVLIQVGPLDKNCLNKNLKYLMKTRTYFIWPEDPDKRSEFWTRLRKVLSS